MKKIFVAGISYKTAPVALRERHAVAPADRPAVARRIRTEAGLEEIVLLWTCNRVEIYGVAEEPAERLRGMPLCFSGPGGGLPDGVYLMEGTAALEHLFSVASGMDSMVLGETEITGQVKDAYEMAHIAGLTGRILNKSFQKAFEVAKEIRTSTGIGRGATSVGSVTAQHAEQFFGGSLRDVSALIIGAGKIAETCVRHLVKKGVREMMIANRSYGRAEQLATEFGGVTVPYEQFLSAMRYADIVIGSTGSSEAIIRRADVEPVMAHRGGRRLLMVDIAVPRDIDADVGGIPGVRLHDMDSLRTTADQNRAGRQQEIVLCDSLIRSHAEKLRPYFERVLGAASAGPVDGLISCG